MKTGVIVYVVGNKDRSDDFDEKNAARQLDVHADKVEFVFSGEKERDIADAWWHLTAKGMSRIICMAAELITPSTLRLIGREMQLAAY